MAERVYMETSVIGAYFDERADIVSSAQRYWSRLWWDEVRDRYEVVISRVVVDELSHPNFPHSQEALDLVRVLPEVPIEDAVRQIVQTYIQNRVMPANPVGDALHLALASLHKCDYLLTWNCKHIANPNKFRRIRMSNLLMGLYVPFLVTPNQLMGG